MLNPTQVSNKIFKIFCCHNFILMNTIDKNQLSEFQKKLKSKIDTSSKFVINVRRSNLLEDSFKQILNSTSKDHLKQIEVHFDNENTEPTEELTKEWLNLLIDEIIQSSRNLFTHSETYKYYPSTKSGVSKDKLDYFRFSGIIFALSIIYDASPKIYFSTFFIKHLLRQQVTMDDIKEYDPIIYDSYQYILQHGVEKTELTFETSVDTEEGRKDIELIPNGSKIPVTDENKNEYISSLVDFLLKKSIQKQTQSFCEGFDSLLPHNDIGQLNPDELNCLIHGSLKIDVNELKKRIGFDETCNMETPVVKYFFEALSSWSDEQLARLLFFTTGISSMTKGNDKLFCISVINGQNEALPTAHVVVRNLTIPNYSSVEELNKKFTATLEFTEILSGNE